MLPSKWISLFNKILKPISDWIMFFKKKEKQLSSDEIWTLNEDINWQKIYSKEINNCIQITHNKKKQILPQVGIFLNYNLKVKSNKIFIRYESSEFTIGINIQNITIKSADKIMRSLAKKTKLNNEVAIRLSDLTVKDDLIILDTQRAQYFQYLATNLILDEKDTPNSKSLRELVNPSNSLEPLNNSQLANLLGINILIFTSNHSIILQKRSQQVAFRKGQWVPSASGTVKYEDILGSNNKDGLMPFDGHNIMREAREELGITINDYNLDSLRFLGITRELIRGGQPEIFFSIQLTLTEEDIKFKWNRASDQYESNNLLFMGFDRHLLSKSFFDYKDFITFSEYFDRVLNKTSTNSSITLLTILALWYDQIIATKSQLNNPI